MGVAKMVKKKKKKKKINKNKKFNILLAILCCILLIVLILIIGIVFFMPFKSTNSKKLHLENIEIENNEYLPEFDKGIYDYYLLTDDKNIKIKCDVSKKLEVTGCDEEIDLSNYSNYIHQIIVNDETIYNINIKVKEYLLPEEFCL